ncbi:Na+/H+ antiporter subunit E [Curtobacterium sp. RRHDQ10]|uniref:Na+/H+ antiporter subunit E n=1 Tax=Curtobacterium phyllosphaerae TaxID=3413379 RepID=UPI003BF3AD53
MTDRPDTDRPDTDRTSGTGRRRPAFSWRYEVPLVLGLVVLWAMLWGSWTPLTLLTGVVLAVLVTQLLPLPPIPLSSRLDPFRLVVLLAVFVVQVVVASFQVSWIAVRRRGAPRSSMVLVPLRTHSDMTFTISVLAISLVPGSYVVEVDLARRRILLHVLDTPDEAAVTAARRSALALEARVIRALGSTEDLEAIR